MTIEQTVEIPPSRRLTIDVPREIPVGRAKAALTLTFEAEIPAPQGKTAVPLLSLRGSCKGEDTLDAYFERKHADKALEDELDMRRYTGHEP